MTKQEQIAELKERIEAKTNEWAAENGKQYSQKIALNSLFGIMASPYFRFFDIRMAKAVTTNGQVCIKGPAKYLQEQIPELKIEYSDTDSLFINMSGVLKKRWSDEFQPGPAVKRDFIKKYNKKVIEPIIKEFYAKMTEGMNTLQNTFEMDFEVIADKTLFVGKKRYVMGLVHRDGYDLDLTGDLELKIRGIEIVRTSTPLVVRNILKDLVKLLMKTNDNDKCIEFIEAFRDEFRKLPFDKIANPRTVNGLSKYSLTDKGLPIHVRAAHIYNRALKDKKLDQYDKINEGEKIKFAYIKTPNIYGSNIIGCKDEMPIELQADFKIDYELQFSKVVIAPIKLMFDAVGFSTERTASLEAFFQ